MNWEIAGVSSPVPVSGKILEFQWSQRSLWPWMADLSSQYCQKAQVTWLFCFHWSLSVGYDNMALWFVLSRCISKVHYVVVSHMAMASRCALVILSSLGRQSTVAAFSSPGSCCHQNPDQHGEEQGFSPHSYGNSECKKERRKKQFILWVPKVRQQPREKAKMAGTLMCHKTLVFIFVNAFPCPLNLLLDVILREVYLSTSSSGPSSNSSIWLVHNTKP